MSEDGISNWVLLREDEEDSGDDRTGLFRDPKVQEFLDWLNTEEDDSEEEDEEEDNC